MALALVVAVILLIPQIRETKHENAERESRQERAQTAAEVRRLRAEQRPRRGDLPAGGRSTLATELERRITSDARRRVAAGKLPTPVRRTDCEPLPTGGRELALACTAVTSDIPRSAVSSGGVVGYPYRALVDPDSGRYAFCKATGQAAEGLLRRQLVRLPRACGG